MIIQELFSNMKSGWHSGRGHKATRQGKYEKALEHYQLAIEYDSRTSKCYSAPNPVTLECLARTYARLGNYEAALLAAEKSNNLYNQLDQNNKTVADCTSRVGQFINILKTGHTDAIKNFLSI